MNPDSPVLKQGYVTDGHGMSLGALVAAADLMLRSGRTSNWSKTLPNRIKAGSSSSPQIPRSRQSSGPRGRRRYGVC